ncbi:MAG: VOC family protein [Dehalococcoidia bacterium]|nr:VOC family protein [Chloroflexota bacterium]
MTTKSTGLKLNHVNHVVYLVRDTKQSMEFYHDFLGIKQIPSQVDNPNITWLQLPSGVMLHLIETDQAPCPDESHIAFEVEDFDAAMEAVKAKGLEISRSGVRNDGQRFLFTHDPDGNRVELCTKSGF